MNIGLSDREEIKLQKLLNKVFVQGNYDGMVKLFHMCYKSVFEEFTEENKPGMEGFLRDLLEEAIKRTEWWSESKSHLRLISK